MKNNLAFLWVALGLAVVALVSAFFVQNWPRTAELSYDLYFAAWRTEPVAVPLLMLVCLGAGLVVGILMVLPGRMRDGQRVTELERKLARMSAGGTDNWS